MIWLKFFHNTVIRARYNIRLVCLFRKPSINIAVNVLQNIRIISYFFPLIRPFKFFAQIHLTMQNRNGAITLILRIARKPILSCW